MTLEIELAVKRKLVLRTTAVHLQPALIWMISRLQSLLGEFDSSSDWPQLQRAMRVRILIVDWEYPVRCKMSRQG